MKCFKVKCKFGHTRRDKYLPMYVPVKAENKKEASALARNCGGVKRNHIDWCLEAPIEISYEEYKNMLKKFRSDLYWKRMTRKNLHLFEGRLADEPNYHRHNGIKINRIEHSLHEEIKL